VTGDGHKEGDGVDKHDVASDRDVAIATHDGDWDVHMGGADVLSGGASGLPFEGTEIGAKEVFGGKDVMPVDGAVRELVIVDN